MQGILLVDKPAGWTSHDVVNYVRKMVARAEGKKPKQVKVGHTGTLDPFATGLLVLLIGKEYTKKAAQLSKLDKTYEVTMRLGAVSSTGDPEGEIKPVSDTAPSQKAIQEALEQFRGTTMQTPPAFSAIKIDGKRAYNLAREGKEVKIEPRKVTINKLELVDYSYPEVKLLADVSSGTYIRSLAEDIGQALGVGAYTSGLKRLKIKNNSVKDALEVKSLTTDSIANGLTKKTL
jgi:tRNA pseudouridine55 synthase